jgi:hypothetical protein
MSKIFTSRLFAQTVLLSLFLVPQGIFAAELIFKVAPNTRAGDSATIIEVRIDPESKEMNVVEGTISFSGTVSDNLSVQIENGQSVLPLWPTPPEYIQSEKVIRFVGGVPGGFSSESLLFRMRLSVPESGNLAISFLKGIGYLNDGKGTRENISSEPIDVGFDKSGNSKLVDTTSGFKGLKNVIIILIVVVFFIIFRYGYKKIIKK